MEEVTCKDCKYYMQHYVKLKGRFTKAGVGHCICPSMKERKIHSKVCANFEEGKATV